MSEGTQKLIEEKHQTFGKWQEECTNVVRCGEYTNCCKKVRKAMREDRKKWLNEMLKEIEKDMK